MKHLITTLIILLILGFSLFGLVGCAKLVNTTHQNVEVTIVDEYHRGTYIMPMQVGKTTIMQTYPAIYEITVEYNGIQYTIDSSDTYDKYKDKIGETTIGILETRIYDDGSIKYDIIGLN